LEILSQIDEMCRTTAWNTCTLTRYPDQWHLSVSKVGPDTWATDCRVFNGDLCDVLQSFEQFRLTLKPKDP